MEAIGWRGPKGNHGSKCKPWVGGFGCGAFLLFQSWDYAVLVFVAIYGYLCDRSMRTKKSHGSR